MASKFDRLDGFADCRDTAGRLAAPLRARWSSWSPRRRVGTAAAIATWLVADQLLVQTLRELGWPMLHALACFREVIRC